MAEELNAAPLHWGNGPTTFEMFVEPTCPFSVKAMQKLEPLLAEAGENRVTIQLRIQSQPWHLLSGIVSRCVLAASTLEAGRDKAWAVLQAVGEHRGEFVMENHCTGPNRQATPDAIIQRIEAYSGVELAAAFDQPALQNVIKWHAKYARQNGIHASPTFLINGLVQPSLGSSDDVSVWADAIRSAAVH